ncbi:hypothetical protein [Roseateles noduli]|uniref:hypothetical protein n=1 Tax=Roseateles noduli TaxID=2052484 RepID=UPI003D64ABF6
MAGSTSNAGAVGGVSGIGAVGRLQASLRDVGGLTPGAVLRLSGGGDRNGGGSGWRLESLDSGEIMTLIEPPLDDLLPGDQVLLRVRAVVPRTELEVIERRRDPANVGAASPNAGAAGGHGDGAMPSAWGQLSALRVDLAQWRRQLLTAIVETPPARTPAGLVSAWTLALAHGQMPVGPGGEPLWLLPISYWVRREGRDPGDPPGRPSGTGSSARHDDVLHAPAASAQGEEPALSLLLRWRAEAVGLQLQGTRAALALTVLAEHDHVLTALRGELPRVVAALVRAGFRLRRLGWRKQPLWVPVDPSPPMRSDTALLTAAAELVTALG